MLIFSHRYTFLCSCKAGHGTGTSKPEVNSSQSRYSLIYFNRKTSSTCPSPPSLALCANYDSTYLEQRRLNFARSLSRTFDTRNRNRNSDIKIFNVFNRKIFLSLVLLLFSFFLSSLQFFLHGNQRFAHSRSLRNLVSCVCFFFSYPSDLEPPEVIERWITLLLLFEEPSPAGKPQERCRSFVIILLN